LNNDVSTVIAAKTGANTGLIRYEMKKSREMLVKAL
jgi:predicted regulator of Ras-like GTPase activity (Roadblock/LC7/MglB family)